MRTLKGVDIEIDEDRMELHILKSTRGYNEKRHYQLVKLGNKDVASAVVKAMTLMEPRHA